MRKLLVIFLLGVGACSPPYRGPSALDLQWRAEQAARQAKADAERAARNKAETDAAEAARKAKAWFYQTYPILVGREKCVNRAAATLSNPTWGDVARVAISFCVAPPPPLEGSRTWVITAATDDNHNVFVDAARIEFRKENQITYWELVERFNDQEDFFLMRLVGDCDKKTWAGLTSTSILTGRYVNSTDNPTLNWQNALPGTVGESILNKVCALRAAHVAKKPNPPPRSVKSPPDFSKPQI